jgi:hypothetical protein
MYSAMLAGMKALKTKYPHLKDAPVQNDLISELCVNILRTVKRELSDSDMEHDSLKGIVEEEVDIYKYCIANGKFMRNESAPRVSVGAYVSAMSRRMKLILCAAFVVLMWEFVVADIDTPIRVSYLFEEMAALSKWAWGTAGKVLAWVCTFYQYINFDIFWRFLRRWRVVLYRFIAPISSCIGAYNEMRTGYRVAMYEYVANYDLDASKMTIMAVSISFVVFFLIVVATRYACNRLIAKSQ